MFRFSALSRIQKYRPVIKRSKSTRSGGGGGHEQRAKQSRRMSDPRTQQPDTVIPRRHWETTRLERVFQSGQQSPGRDNTLFTLVSYNILAQDLLESHPELYDGIPDDHLKWSRRKSNLLREINQLRPDVLCIQEIQSDHLENFSAALLERFTFDKVFKKRTGIEKTDGCAIYFNPDLFELVDVRTIEFNQKVPLLDRDNVGIVVKLRSRANPANVFLVATTHLLFNPKRLDIKLAQVHVLLAELEQMAFYRAGGHDQYYPIILTGDMNMEPDCIPYSLLADGKVELPDEHPIITNDLGITNTCQHVQSLKYGRDENHSQLIHSERGSESPKKRKANLNEGYENLYDTGSLSHQLNLTSVYRQFEGRSSTHHHDWIIVDYMFYSRHYNAKYKKLTEGNLRLLGYLELPSTEDCVAMDKMPNEMLGSDHFSLAARFMLGSSK